MTDTLKTGPADAAAHLILAHGAGAPMDSPFMTGIAAALDQAGVRVTRFEFPYMAERRGGGKRKPPPRAEALMEDYLAVVREIAAAAPSGQRLFIGGKSMGGRVASLVADRLYAEGLIVGLACLGYPFHPPAKPEHQRTSHLATLGCPALIVQGERDPFGTREEVESYPLSATIRVVWMGDGDHDFGPRGASGFTRKGNLAAACEAVSAFLAET